MSVVLLSVTIPLAYSPPPLKVRI